MNAEVQYNFLILCGLFAVPPLVILVLRADLRRPMAIAALFALPFALTESWFYPEYWRPKFVFDLADRIGFGLEDLLFVAALSAFTCGAYPALTGLRFVPRAPARASHVLRRAALVLAALIGSVAVLRVLGVPTIYGTCAAMVLATLVILVPRRDLLAACAGGALATLLVYTLLCAVFERLLPGVFALAWNTRLLSNIFILSVPLEELLYAFSAGFAGTSAYPFLMNQALARQAPRSM